MTKNKTVTIRGIEYPSASDAARALGLNRSAISRALRSGNLNDVGLGGNKIKRKPITIRGLEYESIYAAAKALGVEKSLLQMAIKRGTLDNVGLGKRTDAGPDHVANKPITIRGIEYPSRTIAAEVLGVTHQTIRSAEKRGTLSTVGLGLRGRPAKQW